MSGSGQPVSSPMSAPIPPRAQFVEDFFIYHIDQLALAPAASANANFQIQADSDFKLLKMTYAADIAAAAQTASSRVIPNCTMMILDSGSGRNLFSNPVPIPSVMGEGDLPFIVPLPRIFKARSNIQLTLANYDAAVTYNLRLSFIGTKIFQLGPA